MRLNKIKLAGFKSFVDPTSITLPSQMIGVVGPNGCGKSNVIDAVRWVMGESSAKNLRGTSLTDVIFNGSKDRKPVGHATIELVFDNTEGTLGGQYAQYNEISVKRKLSRDGQSVYYLNGARCRRRDITDIFLGTGLGPRSYAIIEQGTISRLIEAKPEELRVFLEEAAGISKYKERRRETENRIRHTHDNLSRIKDLIGELEKRLQVLQRQASTAEKYKTLKTDERLLKAQLLVLRWQAMDAEAGVMELDIKRAETALEACIAEQRSIEAEIEKQHQRQLEANEAFNLIQGRFYSAGAEIARVEQAIQHATETRQKNQRELEELEKNWAESSMHLENDQRQIEALNEKYETFAPELEISQAQQEQSSEGLVFAEQAMQDWQIAWDTFNTQAANEMREAEVEQTRIQHLEDEMQKIRSRQSRLNEERGGLDSSSVEEEMSGFREKDEENSNTISSLQENLHSLLEKIEAQKEANKFTASDLNEQREKLQAVQKRHASMEALQQAALGKQEGAVAEWLQACELGDKQRLAETLQVDNGWETAVETVLGMNLEAVCVEGIEAVSLQLASLNKGTLTLFDTTATSSIVVEALSTPLASKVKAPWQLDSMFAEVYVAETLNDALALRERLDAKQSVVSKQGVWIGKNWLRVARPADEKAGVLVRETELKQLSGQLESLNHHVAELKQQAEEGAVRSQTFDEERNAIQLTLNKCSQQHAELRAKLSSLEARCDQLNTRKAHVDRELKEIVAQYETGENEVRGIRGRLEALLLATEQHEKNREELSQQRDECRNALDQARTMAQQSRDQVREISIRIETTQSQLQSLKSSLERMHQQQAHLSRRREELTEALSQGETPVATMQAELEQLLGNRLAIEAELSTARQLVADTEHALRELGDKRGLLEQRSQEKRSELEKMRMAWQTTNVRRQTFQEQLDESDHKRDDVQRDMPEGAEEASWHQQVEKMAQRIQRLGAINLAAIDEFAEESKRKEYLDSQSADLIEAMTTLENAIRKMDQETRLRFKETFDQVNDKLKEFFPRLFGGGMARLEMTGDDLLDAGVIVMAHPPGKRNSSIHLLSGGEKALTAVALVFAMFELNPAPFCMLDEVDAPLDDSNTGRFIAMVKEMSERVQFIFITHNKITMELADQLVGVTMHEPGVSRMVAVDVAEAVEMAEAG